MLSTDNGIEFSAERITPQYIVPEEDKLALTTMDDFVALMLRYSIDGAGSNAVYFMLKERMAELSALVGVVVQLFAEHGERANRLMA
jgi:hypothetical protein